MRPIDKKLKYQVDKVVRTAASGGTGKACDNWINDNGILLSLFQDQHN